MARKQPLQAFGEVTVPRSSGELHMCTELGDPPFCRGPKFNQKSSILRMTSCGNLFLYNSIPVKSLCASVTPLENRRRGMKHKFRELYDAQFMHSLCTVSNNREL